MSFKTPDIDFEKARATAEEIFVADCFLTAPEKGTRGTVICKACKKPEYRSRKFCRCKNYLEGQIWATNRLNAILFTTLLAIATIITFFLGADYWLNPPLANINDLNTDESIKLVTELPKAFFISTASLTASTLLFMATLLCFVLTFRHYF